MNVVATFEKVSYEQFEYDMMKLLEQCGGNMDKNVIRTMYDSIKLPQRATQGSAGHDFYAPFEIYLEPNQSVVIPTGIRCKILLDWFLGILPRSGQGFKYGLRVINTMGVIDSDYYKSDNEGHIMVKLINDSAIGKNVLIESGTAFVQGIFMQYGISTTDLVGRAADKVRNGGFGSTDEK